jgi:hypothetical protein
MSVSSAFLTVSLQVGAAQVKSGAQTPLWQSQPVLQP